MNRRVQFVGPAEGRDPLGPVDVVMGVWSHDGYSTPAGMGVLDVVLGPESDEPGGLGLRRTWPRPSERRAL
ncbi:hypothetical protein FB470_001119 [Amycolatopsis thermophila]|uniref:Uncharacterized protein n=1 Tax=Amycolatopsis thermophila TaxID=206084 RepID=A0ABU0EQ64_9PSEU|nr:hypothetical protein [Amycolatopsis thermophila]